MRRGIVKVSEGSGRLPALARPLWPVRASLDERRTSVSASAWLVPRTLAAFSTLQRSSPPARLACTRGEARLTNSVWGRPRSRGCCGFAGGAADWVGATGLSLGQGFGWAVGLGWAVGVHVAPRTLLPCCGDHDGCATSRNFHCDWQVADPSCRPQLQTPVAGKLQAANYEWHMGEKASVRRHRHITPRPFLQQRSTDRT